MNFKEFNGKKRSSSLEFFVPLFIVFLILFLITKSHLEDLEKLSIFATIYSAILGSLIFLGLHFFKLYYGKDVEYMEKREYLLILIAENSENLLTALYLLETQGYPVLEAIKESKADRNKLLPNYLDFLEELFVKKSKELHDGTQDGKIKPNFDYDGPSGEISKIKELPSWGEWEARKEKKLNEYIRETEAMHAAS